MFSFDLNDILQRELTTTADISLTQLNILLEKMLNKCTSYSSVRKEKMHSS